LRALSRAIGPVLGPFESYLTMRGIKTLPLRMERQCSNACRMASWLASHDGIERVYFPADPAHPDAREISPRHRERMGIRDSLVRLSLGIEAVEDVIEDLEQALRQIR
jgi:cystathionine beta-lyase/cystathionine gamma-synthase